MIVLSRLGSMEPAAQDIQGGKGKKQERFRALWHKPRRGRRGS